MINREKYPNKEQVFDLFKKCESEYGKEESHINIAGTRFPKTSFNNYVKEVFKETYPDYPIEAHLEPPSPFRNIPRHQMYGSEFKLFKYIPVDECIPPYHLMEEYKGIKVGQLHGTLPIEQIYGDDRGNVLVTMRRSPKESVTIKAERILEHRNR